MLADDIRFALEGTAGVVAKGIVEIAEEPSHILEDVLHLQLSRDKEGVEGKTVALASSRYVAARMEKGMTRMGIRTKARVRNLGVDFWPGRASRRSKRQVLGQRIEKVNRWMGRAKRCGRRGRQAVMRTAVAPAISYGVAVTSVQRRYMQRLRAEAARGYGPIEGRSVTARQLIEEADVEQTFIEKAIMFWVDGAVG